jgi:FkbM family methyltransferase
MQSVSVRRLQGRKNIRARFGNKVFDYKIIQVLLGFDKVGTTVLDKLNNTLIEYDFHSAIGQCMFFGGAFEQDEIEFFTRALAHEAKPVVLDVGANIGLHSIHWARANRTASIFAFEPSPATGKILRRNLQRNSLDKKIELIPLAVSDTCGKAQFFECDDNAFSSLKDTRRKRVVRTHLVPVTTIDEFVAEHHLDRISLLKIDVEGFEREVISGATTTLRLLKPDLFVEIYSGTDSNPDPEGTIDLIRSQGYRAYVLVAGKPVAYEKHVDSLYNYYFTCKDNMPWTMGC